MANICIVKSCASRRNNKDIRFHQFPDNPDIKQKWVTAIFDSKDKLSKPNSKLCNLHFKRSDYVDEGDGHWRLKKTAIPTRNLINSAAPSESTNENLVTSLESGFALGNEDKQQNSKFTCRACLSKGSQDFQLILEKNLNCYFTDLTRIEIKDVDGLTKMLCNKCSAFLILFNSFKSTCLHSDKVLQQIYGKYNTHDEIKEETIDNPSTEMFPNNFCDESRFSLSVIKKECDIPDNSKIDKYAASHSEPELKCESEVESTATSAKKGKMSGVEKTKYKKTMQEHGFVKCPYCDKQFTKLGTFYKHKRDHFTTSMCDLCGYQFSSSRALRTHNIFKHQDERKFKCNLCDFAFKIKSSLECHIQSRHTKERNYVCDRCSATFKSKRGVQAHIRMIHSNKPLLFACDHCDKKFKTRAHLLVHKQSHTNEKMFFCPLCRTEFTTKKYRNIHMEKKRCQNKPYQCHVCLQIFKEKRNHKIHMRRFHPEIPESEAKAVHIEHQQIAVEGQPVNSIDN